MADKASKQGITLKPHFKTHQSAEIGNWFRDFGVEAITVSSVAMARYFAENGWRDITIAFPVNTREIEAINKLAEEIDRLSLFLVNVESAYYLKNNLARQVDIYIEIDTGSGRSGFLPQDIGGISELVEIIGSSGLMKFKGFYSHPGHTYSARSSESIIEIQQEVLSGMKHLKEHFNDAHCCIGDTPSCSVADDFGVLDEISPGNFVFYDLMQVQIGSCSIDDIAVMLAAPIVAKYPQRNELVLHAGAVHLSKEKLSWGNQEIYGLPAKINDTSWSKPFQSAFLKSISQEHGILQADSSLIKSVNTGDLLGIFPVHSCLTANLMGSYYSIQDGKFIH